MKRHPYLAASPLFLTGQSYSGHYLPLLVMKLLDKNIVGTRIGQINLRGMIPVNAWTDTLIDNEGAVNWWFGQGLISARIKDGLLDPKACHLDKGALWRTSGPNELSAQCNAIRDKVSLS